MKLKPIDLALTRRATPSLLTGLLIIGMASAALAGRCTVVLPAGSTDGDLAAAIAAAGPRGTVIVESGLHEETGTVLVDIPVSIIGEEGAVLEVSTVPNEPDAGGPPHVELNESGILSVSARDTHTGQEQRATVNVIGAQSPEQVAASRQRMTQLRGG